MIRPTRRPTLYIDFGLDRVAVVQVAGDEVTGWALRDLPPGLVRNGDPVDAAQLATLIREMVRQQRMTAVRARFTIPDEAVVFRVVDLPALPRRHLARALTFVVDREVPLPVDRIRWAWDVMQRTDIGYRVCLVAAWGDVVGRIEQVARLAGLNLEVLEPRSLAVARSLDPERSVVFDASAERLQVLVLRRGLIPFVEQAPIATDPKACARTLERLLRRGYNDEEEAAQQGQVVLAGELEELVLPLSMPTISAAQFRKGLPPRQSSEIPVGSLLANLGMATPSGGGGKTRSGIPSINLVQVPRRAPLDLKRFRAALERATRGLTARPAAGRASQAGRQKVAAPLGGIDD